MSAHRKRRRSIVDDLVSRILTGDLLDAFVQRMVFDPNGLCITSCVCHEWHAAVVRRVCAHMRKINFLMQEMAMACLCCSKRIAAQEYVIVNPHGVPTYCWRQVLSASSMKTNDRIADTLYDTSEDRFFAHVDAVEEIVDKGRDEFWDWCDPASHRRAVPPYEYWLLEQEESQALSDSELVKEIRSLVYETAEQLTLHHRVWRFTKMLEMSFGHSTGKALSDILWHMCAFSGNDGGLHPRRSTTGACFYPYAEVVDKKDKFVETTPMHDALRSMEGETEGRLRNDINRMSKRLLATSIERYRTGSYALKYLKLALDSIDYDFEKDRRLTLLVSQSYAVKRGLSQEAAGEIDYTVLWPYLNAETTAAFFALQGLHSKHGLRCELCNAEPYRMAFAHCKCDHEGKDKLPLTLQRKPTAWLCAPPPLQADGRLVVAPVRCMQRRCLPMSTMISFDDTDEHGYPLALRFNLFQTVPLLCQEHLASNEELPFCVHNAATEFNSNEQGGVKWANLPSHETVPGLMEELPKYPIVVAETLAMTKHMISLNAEGYEAGVACAAKTARVCLRNLFEEKCIMGRFFAMERSHMPTLVLPNASLSAHYTVAKLFVWGGSENRFGKMDAQSLRPNVKLIELACDRMRQEAVRAVSAKRALILAEEASLRDLLAEYAVGHFRSVARGTSDPPWLDAFVADVVAPFSTAWRRWDNSIVKEPKILKVLEPASAGLRAGWPRTTTLYRHLAMSMDIDRTQRWSPTTHEDVCVQSPPQTIHELKQVTGGLEIVCDFLLPGLAVVYNNAAQSLPPASPHAWHWLAGTNMRARVDTMLKHLTNFNTLHDESKFLNSMALIFDAIEAKSMHSSPHQIGFRVANKRMTVECPLERVSSIWSVEDIFACGVESWEWSSKSSLELFETLLGAPETRGFVLNVIMRERSEAGLQLNKDVLQRLRQALLQHGITRQDLIGHVFRLTSERERER